MNDLPTLYRLADGTQADPSDCNQNDKGVLTHKSGVPVVIDSDGKPVEILREAEVNKTALAAKLGDDAEASAKAGADNEAAAMRAKAISDGKVSANEARSTAGLSPIPAAPAAKVGDPKPADDGRKNETL